MAGAISGANPTCAQHAAMAADIAVHEQQHKSHASRLKSLEDTTRDIGQMKAYLKVLMVLVLGVLGSIVGLFLRGGV